MTAAPFAVTDRRPITFPDCPHCGEPLRLARLIANHDRPALTYLRCDECGHEQDHAVAGDIEVPA